MGKEIEAQIELRMEFAADLFKESTIKSFMEQYLYILIQVINDKYISLDKIVGG